MSDHFNGSRFFNPRNPHRLSLWKVLRWRLTAKPKAWPKEIPIIEDHPPERINTQDLRVSFIGHSTVLIQTEGLNILTDPVWAEYATPFRSKWAKRVSKPGISIDRLPKIDLILVSHNHYDHLDKKTLQILWKRDQPKIIMPLGNEKMIRLPITTLDWGDYTTLNQVKIHLEPALHWSRRGFFDTNKALWGAFVIETPSSTIYFAGDTGYGTGETFRNARAKFPHFRFALLPIGTYEPRWFMHPVHMSAEEAVRACKELGSPYAMGIHFATFRLSDESYEDPINLLENAKQRHALAHDRFRALRIGESWMIP